MSLIDCHVHLQDKRFTDPESVLKRAKLAGVTRVITASTSPGDWNAVIWLAHQFPPVCVTYGVHPWYAARISGDWLTWLTRLIDYENTTNDTLPGIGEIGLDFAMRVCDKGVQEEVFTSQLELASTRKRPVVIHSVRANDRILELLPKYAGIPALLMHGFTGTADQISRLIDLGAWFSFSWTGLQRSSGRGEATLAAVPRDRILLESDGPILMPNRDVSGQATPTILVQELKEDGSFVDEPATLPKTLARVAELKKQNVIEFTRQLERNQNRFMQHWTDVK